MRFAIERHAAAEDAAMHGNRLVFPLGDREKRGVWRMKMRDRDRVRPRGMNRRVNGPFARRADRPIERIAVEIGCDHVFGAEIRFVSARARRNQDPLRVGLVNADMTVQAQKALHREDARAGGQLLSQFVFQRHETCPSSASLPGSIAFRGDDVVPKNGRISDVAQGDMRL
jgi:hypothetical protein